MTKADIIDAVYANVGLKTKADATNIVDDLFTILKETLVRGERIKISGFGSFELNDKHARLGRNPKTGEAMTIEARRVVSFKISAILKKALNPEGEGK